jgi:hypothetical protein
VLELARIYFLLEFSKSIGGILMPKPYAGWQRPRPWKVHAAAAGLAAMMSVSSMGAAAFAQVQTVERTAKGQPAKEIQVGVYLNVQPDCTSGTLPAIRLVSPPANGAVNIKRGKVSATNYKQCLALEVPGFIAFYRSKPDFSGTDILTIEVKYPSGRTEVQRISVTVGGGPDGQKI